MLRTLIYSRRILIPNTRFYATSWEEVRIPVPWGHVAGKWWGPQDKRPIFASHGWLDNSGTFDTLIPLLPKTCSFFAIDYPGCGYSSKLPPGSFYHFMDFVILIRRIVKYFKWEKVSFLGHSMGAMMNYTYAMLFPEDVDFLMCLDGFSPITTETDDKLIAHMQKNINNFLKYDSINSRNEGPPSYSYQEIEQRMHVGYRESVDLNKCKYILDRNIQPSSKDPNKYYFSTDARLKVWELLRWSEEECIENAHRIAFPTILIKMEKSPFFRHKEYAAKVIDIISKTNKNFEMHSRSGTHHLHLNNPELVEGLLNQFIKKYEIDEKSQSGFTKNLLAHNI